MIFWFSMVLWILTPHFQVDDEPLATSDGWLRYPVSTVGLGEGGTFETDLTAEAATPVLVIVGEEDGDLLVSRDVSTFLAADPQVPDLIRLEHAEPNQYVFQSGAPDASGTVTIWLTRDAEVLRGAAHIRYGMGEAREFFLLAPADLSDPRAVEGERCAGGPRIRLKIGDVAVTGLASGEIALYEHVDGRSAIRAPVHQVQVVAGPRCVGPVAWWQVSLLDDPDSVAWTPEMGSEGSYVLHPVQHEETPAPTACSDALASRLSVGAFVHPVPDREPPTLHASPSESSAVLATLSAATVDRVLAGPVCTEGHRWWRVAHQGHRGWVAEGQGEHYALEPNPAVILSERLQALVAQG